MSAATFGNLASVLAENGYRPVPIRPGKKAPVPDDWPNYQFSEPDAKKYRTCGVGIITGNVGAIDIDVRDAALAEKLRQLATDTFGPMPARIGQAPKVAVLFRVDGGTFEKMSTHPVRLPGDAPGDKPHRVEVLGLGQQLVAYGTHPDTGKPYLWNGAGDPLNIPAGLLPPISLQAARDYLAAAESMLLEVGKPCGRLSEADDDRERDHRDKAPGQLLASDPALLRQALAAIPNDDVACDDWQRIGMAIKGALGDDGRGNFLEWSAKSVKHDPETTAKAWDSFDPRRIGAGTIYYLAECNGWTRRGREDEGSATGGSAAAWEVEPLDILRQTVAPAFDAGDVPHELGRFAIEWAAAAGFDSSGVIAATVGAAAAVLSDGLRLEVNRASEYYESARVWLLLLGLPGVAKTPSLSAATAPIRAMHRQAFEDWQRECVRVRKVAEASGEPPEIPPRPALYTSDATVEALAETLAANPRGLLFLNEEFESWLGSHDAYRGGGSKDRGEWLRAFDGGPHQVDRIKRGAFFVPNWGLSILSATTPSALQKLARRLPADGLLQRFIPVLVQPGRQADPFADASRFAQDYYNTLARLYEYGPGSGVRVVTLTHEAAELLRTERERLRRLAVAVQVYGDGFAGHVAKHAAMLARVALVFHALTGHEHPAERRLEAASVTMAARFMHKAFRHAQALYADILGGEGAVSLARAVAASLLADKRSEITRRELTHSCHAWRKADERDRDEAARFLVDVGWLCEEHGEYIKPHVTRWSVNPSALARFAEYGEQHRQRRREVVEAIRGNSE